jgi:hypothetical protein
MAFTKQSDTGTETIKLSSRMHPDYVENIDRWTFYLESFFGGESYIRKHLFTHRLESPEDYRRRMERAYYLNYCAPLVAFPADYIFKKEATRPPDANLERFRQNTDLSGSNINAFMKRACILSSIFGHIHILIDRPKPSSELMAAVTEGKTTKNENLNLYPPYAVLISPINVMDWSINPQDKSLNWVLIQEPVYIDDDPFQERKVVTYYKLWTRDRWQILDEDNNLIEEGIHNLGIVPIVTCFHKDINKDMLGESMLRDVAETNRIIFNWCSNIDEMIARQTFSQLICPDDGSTLSDELDEQGKAKSLRALSSSTIFTFPADSRHPPAFISPDTSQIAIIWQMIENHVRELFRLAGLISAKSTVVGVSQRSGISQQYDFLDMSVFLSSKAKYLEEAENAMNEIVYRWLGIAGKPERVYYPDKFDVTSPSEVIDLFTKVTLNVISGRLNKEMAKRLAMNVLPNADDRTMTEIFDEIEKNNILADPTVLLGLKQPPGVGQQAGSKEQSQADQQEGQDVTQTKERMKNAEPVPNARNPKERAKFRPTHRK